jgi:hypothetical protein
MNLAGMGGFSADRTVREYVERVWSAASLPARTKAPAIVHAGS